MSGFTSNARSVGSTLKAVAAAVALVALSAPFGVAQAAPGDGMYARPWRLVFAGDPELNLYCKGSSSPTVIFDAGWEDRSPTWDLIQPTIARHTRTCTYDPRVALSSRYPMLAPVLPGVAHA